jgi:hypothetical protein
VTDNRECAKYFKDYYKIKGRRKKENIKRKEKVMKK